MFGFTIAHVRGDSMLPRLRDGDLKIFRRKRDYHVGDIVLADHPDLGLIIKQISARTDDAVRLKGMNAMSVSEASLGKIPLTRVRGRLIGQTTSKNKNVAEQ